MSQIFHFVSVTTLCVCGNVVGSVPVVSSNKHFVVVVEQQSVIVSWFFRYLFLFDCIFLHLIVIKI
jgi:hypothetical protein